MFSIGEFAALTRISIRMLRHYDELGLLKPRHIDGRTGFRYYGADQLARLNRLIAFKDLGFSLEQIGLLLDANLSAEQLKAMFDQKKKEIAQEAMELQHRLKRLDRRLADLNQATTLPQAEVVVRPVGPQLVAASGFDEPDRLADLDLAVAEAFDTLERWASRHRVRREAPPLTVYRGFAKDFDRAGFEVAVPITQRAAAPEPIRVYELPGCELAACLIHSGSYRLLSETLDFLLRWVKAGPYRAAGPLRELYLRFNASLDGYTLPEAFLADDENLFVTELQLPVEKI